MNENDARAALRAIVAALEEALVEKAGPELARKLGRRVSDTEVRQYLALKRAPENGQQQPIARLTPQPVGPKPRPSPAVRLKMCARLLARHGFTDVDWR